MTQREMDESFLAQIHNFDTDSEYEFQTHEKNIFLTRAYKEIVDELYGNFEKSERVRKLLLPLTYNAEVTDITSSSLYTNAFVANLFNVTPQVLYILSEEIVLSNETRLIIKPITLDSYTANKPNPFKKPYKRLAWRLDIGNGTTSVYLICTYTPAKYSITYLRHPEEINVTSDSSILINKDVHTDIVDRAVQHALSAKQTNKNLKS